MCVCVEKKKGGGGGGGGGVDSMVFIRKENSLKNDNEYHLNAITVKKKCGKTQTINNCIEPELIKVEREDAHTKMSAGLD